MRLRWNPDGKGKRSVPAGLREFALKKRREFIYSLLKVACYGVVVGTGAALLIGGVDYRIINFHVFYFEASSMLLVLAITVVVSAVS